MAAFDTLAEFKDAIFWATGFLVHGLLYSHLPYEEIEAVRKKNSRLGLGLMGIAHWFYKKGLKYGEITEEVTKWFQTYKDESDRAAKYWAKKLGVAEPIAVRAIAPTGTIALISDTTSGIEPPYLLAYRRMWLEQGKTYMAQNCIDAAAQALIADGVLPENIETAYDLAKEPERRIAFQYWVQQFVDQSISSTLNLPSWGSEYNNPSTVETFGSMLLKYLPGLRGITTYPDGARGGQPISPIDYQEALATQGITYEVNDQCKSGVCGI
jgi:ribonucleoside-diphosphate reductase alpha chain